MPSHGRENFPSTAHSAHSATWDNHDAFTHEVGSGSQLESQNGTSRHPSFWKRHSKRIRSVYYSFTERAGYGPSDISELIHGYFEYAKTDIADSGGSFSMLLALGWDCRCENVKRMAEAATTIQLDEQIAKLVGYLRYLSSV